MLGFNFKNKNFLGIDIGTSSLKIVELEMKGDKPRLVNYAWIKIGDKNVGDKNNDNDSEFFKIILPKYLKRIIQESKFKSKNAYIAIPAFGGLITLIELPNMPDEDIEQAVKFEATKYIPTSLDEVVLSWEIIKGESQAKEKKTKPEVKNKIRILLVVASKSKINAYEKVVREVGLIPAGIEIENLAMINSLIGKDKGRFIIVDIGASVCNIIYVERGVLKINRNIDAGGFDLTDTIAKSLGISEKRAEEMKISEKSFFSKESSIKFPNLESIAEEIARILATILKEDPNIHIDALILSGGTANLQGIDNFFQTKLNIKTVIGNPFSRVEYDSELESVIDKIKAQFSVAVGLALMGINTNKS